MYVLTEESDNTWNYYLRGVWMNKPSLGDLANIVGLQIGSDLIKTGRHSSRKEDWNLEEVQDGEY